jgi:hypothetical protein
MRTHKGADNWLQWDEGGDLRKAMRQAGSVWKDVD